MKAHLKNVAIGLAMMIAAVMAYAMKPTHRIADTAPKVNLETMIPRQFGDWRVDENTIPLQISPDVQANLDKIYNQTLSRTYFNSKGERMMLSIAYGGDQSDSMQVHKPEVCYPAQGFQVIHRITAMLQTEFYRLPVVRMVATLNNRVEPITYWIVIGDKVPGSGVAWKIEQLKYGLTGKVPDGLLFRVSSISMNQDAAFAEQASFINELIKGVSQEARARLIGKAI